ncbi:MAG: DUF445 family protein [Bacillota bacterium]|nr:DUF445 family protein [Bacillota bacterium]
MLLKLGVLAVIGAFIGWMTNVFAIKLLFRPFKEINILGFKIQGLIPKRRTDIAKSIGETIDSELVSLEKIIDDFIEGLDKLEVKNLIKARIENIIKEKLPPLIPVGMVMMFVNDVIESQGDQLIDEIIEKMISKATASIKIDEIVEDNINKFELEKIESIILDLAKTELKHIEYLGGAIGFMIGIVQGLIILNI